MKKLHVHIKSTYFHICLGGHLIFLHQQVLGNANNFIFFTLTSHGNTLCSKLQKHTLINVYLGWNYQPGKYSQIVSLLFSFMVSWWQNWSSQNPKKMPGQQTEKWVETLLTVDFSLDEFNKVERILIFYCYLIHNSIHNSINVSMFLQATSISMVSFLIHCGLSDSWPQILLA